MPEYAARARSRQCPCTAGTGRNHAGACVKYPARGAGLLFDQPLPGGVTFGCFDRSGVNVFKGHGKISWRTLPALLAAVLLLHAQAVWACAGPLDMAEMPCCPEQHEGAAPPVQDCAEAPAGAALCAKPYAPATGQAVHAAPEKSSPDGEPPPGFDPQLLPAAAGLLPLASAARGRAGSMPTAGPAHTGRLLYLTTLRLRL